MSYKARANAVVIVEWIFFVVYAGAGFFIFIYLVKDLGRSIELDGKTAIIYAVMISIAVLVAFLLNVFLMKAVKEGRPTSLKMWYITTIIGTGLYVIQSVVDFIAGIRLLQMDGRALPLIISLVVRCGVLFYRVWSIYVIHHFSVELTLVPGVSVEGGTVYTRYPITQRV